MGDQGDFVELRKTVTELSVAGGAGEEAGFGGSGARFEAAGCWRAAPPCGAWGMGDQRGASGGICG